MTTPSISQQTVLGARARLRNGTRVNSPMLEPPGTSGTVIAPIATRSGCECDREEIAERPGPGGPSSPLIQAACR
jgi:hypothetical protein